jgi:drug/metabolite transporter (DMT)-like permease
MSLVTIVWAGNFTAGKVAAAHIDPLLIASIRIFLAAAFFYAFLPPGQKRQLFTPALLRACTPLALTGIATNQFCFAAGIQRTVPSHSAIIHALIPVFVAIIGWIFLRERVGLLGLFGMLLALGGVFYVILSGDAKKQGETLVGDLLTLAGAVAFSAYAVIGRSVIPAIGAWRAVTIGFIISVPLSIPLFILGLQRQHWAEVTPAAWVGLGYMIVGATFFCYSAHMWSLTHLNALQVSIFVELQPMLGTAIAALFAVEEVTRPLVWGGLVALAGVTLVQLPRSVRADKDLVKALE